MWAFIIIYLRTYFVVSRWVLYVVFTFSSVCLLVLISSFVPLWPEKMPDIISAFSLLGFLLWSDIWFILDFVPCILEKNVLCCFWMEYCIKCPLIPSGLTCSSSVVFSNWFFGLDVVVKYGGIEVRNYDCIAVYLSLQVCYYLLYVFRCSCVGCI